MPKVNRRKDRQKHSPG